MILSKALSMLGFAIPLLTEIFIWIDSFVYLIAKCAFHAFFQLIQVSSNITSSNIPEITYILNRVMVLVGVFALFKLAVMLINYLIEPSKIAKGQETGRKFVKNIIIAVILLVAAPTIFDTLNKVQKVVLIDSNVIPKLIYGPTYADEATSDIGDQIDKFVNGVWLQFFTPKDGGGCSGSGKSYCDAYNKVANGESSIASLASSYDHFDYIAIVPFIAGVMLIYYFGVFTLELAKRIFKLLVLQIISPIPIIMSIDPSQEKRLATFGKTYIGLYLQVFIRVVTIYLAFVILSLIGPMIDTLSDSTSQFFIKIILYIGVFQAVKEIPKLLEEVLGIKFGQMPGQSFGKTLAGIIGGTAGFVGGGIAGAVSGGVGGAVAGAFSGMTNVAGGMAKANGNVGQSISAAVKGIKGSHTTGAKVAGAGGLGAFMVGGVENFFGGKGRDEATVKQYDDDIKARDKDIEKIKDKMNTSNKGNEMRNNIENMMQTNYERTHGSLESILENNSEIQSIQEKIANAQTADERSIANAELAAKRNELTNEYNTQRDSYFEEQLRMTSSDFVGPLTPDANELKEMISDYNKFVEENGMADRKITDMTSLDASKHRYELANSNYEKAVERKEQEKKTIEKQKKEFTESGSYKRRNKRDEKPSPSPRNTNNNGNNSSNSN